jgi:drug/metabolite transporter (DMT)-like permease
LFGNLPDGWTLAGAALIIGSGLYIFHREHRLKSGSTR